MRTGRTKDHFRREAEHRRSPETASFKYKTKSATDDYATQRGHEQLLHDEYKPALNKIRPISPTNPNKGKYLEAGQRYRHQSAALEE